VPVTEVDEGELPRWVAAMREVRDETDTVEDYLDWKRQARETVWLLATAGDRDVGAAIGIGGWHAPPGVARGEVRVVGTARGRGTGTELLDKLRAWALGLGYDQLMGPIAEHDAESLAWAQRRGFVEIGRNSKLVLDLTTVAAPVIDPPPGVALVTWAERPDLTESLYAVAQEAYVDVPGEGDSEVAPFDEWLASDMQGAGDRPEATFVALANGEVVAYAKLSLSLARPTVAMHDITGVLRAWRGHGIAGALKRAEIAWAKDNGYERLETMNEERNEPIRRLNERHGYVLGPGEITVRGAIRERPWTLAVRATVPP